MVRLIERLVKNGCAYVAQGHVLFHVASMKDYGKLSNRSLDEMIAGARVEVAPYKKDPMDFVLWKPSPPELPGWDSPWGRGRPGWHIECSAMSAALLGETFDIHGGGIDLVFPHHENEIAQSRCAFHTSVMANYWMHNGFLQVEGEKMAKSAGNFVTIHELLKDWPGEVVRFNMLRTHYRQPIDWTVKGLEVSWKSLEAIYEIVEARVPKGTLAFSTDAPFLAALLDDLNTPQAITELFAVRDSDPPTLAGGLWLLGFSREKANIASKKSIDESAVAEAIEARNAARRAKNFKESDRIRDELAAMGVVLKDSKDGTTWEIAR
jgi:cysteinyl-tRNA synthetase